MSNKTLMELTEIVAKRYLEAKGRKEKTKILDEYCANTNLNRNYAITKIRDHCFKRKKSGKRGRKKVYSSETDALLIKIWKAYNRICAERLQPYLEEGLGALERCGYVNVRQEIREELLRMSVSTVKRRICSHRKLNGGIGLSSTKSGTFLKKHIPLNTQCWDESRAGFCEIDLVAHCGGNLSGDFIYTLQFVDIKTTWTERSAVMGKAQKRVFRAIQHLRELLPFPLGGLDSDNGSEFINYPLFKYCKKENIVFTRSRPYMKKDNAHIEQKNNSYIRKILGYDRFDKQRQLELINDLYDNELRLYLNFFQPSLKLKEKVRVGSKIKRKYDIAKTPYQRVLECPDVSEEDKNKLRALYLTLNPVKLKMKIGKKIRKIISLV